MRDVVRYSEAFKLRLAEDVANGKYQSLEEARRRNWIFSFTLDCCSATKTSFLSKMPETSFFLLVNSVLMTTSVLAVHL
jgi:hypothetical protein